MFSEVVGTGKCQGQAVILDLVSGEHFFELLLSVWEIVLQSFCNEIRTNLDR